MRVMQAFGQLQIPFKYWSKDEITKKHEQQLSPVAVVRRHVFQVDL